MYNDSAISNNRRNKNKKPKKLKKTRIFDYVLTILMGIIVLAPFYILIITSITSKNEANYAEFHWWPQEGLNFKSYYEVLFTKTGDATVIRGLMNTLLMVVPSVTVGIFSSAMAAYAFAKMKFRASSFMFAVLMFTLMFPNTMNMIASFMVFDKIGWVNTPFPLMVPEMMGNVGAMFFLRQYYLSLPQDIINAAKIDGAGHFRIFVKIALPIAIPVLVAQWIFRFMAGYNVYMDALIYLQDAKYYTIQLALAFFVDPYTQNWPLRMAGVVVSLVPMLAIYAFAQKYLTKGMAISSSIKG